MLRQLDRLAGWLANRLDAHAQLRMGIVLVLGSIPLYAYAPLSGEPPVIYLMSAAALTLTGVSIVVAAEVLKRQDEFECQVTTVLRELRAHQDDLAAKVDQLLVLVR